MKRKKASGGRKGSPFEREIAKILSLWWSGGESDALFWRTSTSGARATSRAKKGKSTKNQGGDLCATDPDAQPLIDLCRIEIKRGYSRATLHDLLDQLPGRKGTQELEKWINQVEEACKGDKTPYWLIIHKRDQRVPVVYIPFDLWLKFRVMESVSRLPSVSLTLKHGKLKVSAVTLPAFLQSVSPSDIRKLVEELKGEECPWTPSD